MSEILTDLMLADVILLISGPKGKIYVFRRKINELLHVKCREIIYGFVVRKDEGGLTEKREAS